MGHLGNWMLIAVVTIGLAVGLEFTGGQWRTPAARKAFYLRRVVTNVAIAALPLVLAAAFFVVTVAGLLRLGGAGDQIDGVGGFVGYFATGAGMVVLVLVWARRAWWRGVVVSPAGCEIRTVFNKKHFAWSEVSRFDVEEVLYDDPDAILQKFYFCVLTTKSGEGHRLPLGSPSRRIVEASVARLTAGMTARPSNDR